jgi:dTDP-4-dehydrorhamnose reductase
LPGTQFRGREALDMADTQHLEQAVLAMAPSVIINAAAYTAVDRAESEPALAWRVNAEAPAALARAAAQLDVPLVQISTDYVFDGAAEAQYAPDHPVRPISVYGATKLGGELAVRTLSARHWILRTSWVFSEHGQNFVRTMLRLAARGQSLRIVNDQRGRPTYAGDLARLIVALTAAGEAAGETAGDPAPRLPYGTYHAVSGEALSWHAFAMCIFEEAVDIGVLARLPDVVGVPSSEYPTPAARPRNSVLASSEALVSLADGALDWREGLKAVVARLGKVGPV